MLCTVMVRYLTELHSLCLAYNGYITNCNGVNVGLNSWT